MDITIIGGGMITHDQILPSIYHLQRIGKVGKISVSARRRATIKALRNNANLAAAFPESTFTPYPPTSARADRSYAEMYKEVLAALPPRQVVVVAVPDPDHYRIVMDALNAGQHILCVKPLVLQHTQAREIAQLALQKGLFVGVEYHKRFDRRALIARKDYADGRFGDFAMGEATLIEPYYYRSSNFQSWFTADQTDPFVYVGCHYVDLVYFITGLKPVEVSVAGVLGSFPNAAKAYMWAQGRVRFENGALLHVSAGLGYPDGGAGSNNQGLLMYCEGDGVTGLIRHDDHHRGVVHAYSRGAGPGGSSYNYVNPDYFKLVPWDGAGYQPIGYGFDSIAAILNRVQTIEDAVAGLDDAASLARRQEMIRETDAQGLIATPANSSINELVVEAGRLSILNDAARVRILYAPEPKVELI